MSELLLKYTAETFPRLGEQEGNRDPIVHAVFYFPFSGWIWFAMECEATGSDFLFFGYVIGLEREWGYFCLSELESVNIGGAKVVRVEDHVPCPLSECLKRHGLNEN